MYNGLHCLHNIFKYLKLFTFMLSFLIDKCLFFGLVSTSFMKFIDFYLGIYSRRIFYFFLFFYVSNNRPQRGDQEMKIATLTQLPRKMNEKEILSKILSLPASLPIPSFVPLSFPLLLQIYIKTLLTSTNIY